LEYITAKQSAEKWNITPNRVTILAKSGRIPGAIQIGSQWMIPSETEKPADGRTKKAKEQISTEYFRFPFFAGKDIESFMPPLSAEELQLKKMQDAYMACRFDEARNLMCTLPTTSQNRYLRITALFYNCLISMEYDNVGEVYNYYVKLSVEMQEDFPYKKEFEIILHELDAYLGANSYFINEFKIDPSYTYHPSFLSHLSVLSTFALFVSDLSRLKPIDLAPYELNCATYENTDSYSDSLAIHLYLSNIYVVLADTEKMTLHLRKALRLAEKHELYLLPAMHYYYMEAVFKSVLLDFSEDFANRIRLLSTDVHERYVRFTAAESVNHILNVLPQKDYIFLFYAVQKYTNKEIADILHISENTVGKKYSIIYEKLMVKNKRELVDLYISSINNTGATLHQLCHNACHTS